MNFFWHFFRRFLMAGTLSLMAACSSHKGLDKAADEYSHGQIDDAKSIVEKKIEKSKALQNWQKDKNSVLYLMHGAFLRHSQGQYEEANKCYQKNLEAIDFYKQESNLENLQMLLIDDTQSAYSGDFFEQLLSRLYFALSLQQLGQSDNSAALLRQHEEASALLKEETANARFIKHIQIPSNSLVKYLLACHLEAKSDYSNARILLESCRAEIGRQGFIDQELSKVGKRSKKAWLLVLVHRGQVPFKAQGYAIGAGASLMALETYLQTRDIDPAWSSLTGIAIPEYKDRFNTRLAPISISLDDNPLFSQRMLDVSQMAQDELNQKLPVLTARALARQLMRRAIVYHQQKQSETAGVTADLLLLWANLNTEADTRSWSVLPSELWLSRKDVTPGTFRLKLGSCEPIELTLRPGLNLVEIFAPYDAWVLFGSQKWGPYPFSKISPALKEMENVSSQTPSSP